MLLILSAVDGIESTQYPCRPAHKVAGGTANLGNVIKKRRKKMRKHKKKKLLKRSRHKRKR